MAPQTPVRSGEIVGVRRAPKYGVFAALGAMLGIVAAMILSTVFDGTSEPSRYTEIEYTASQAFGFILLWCLPAGILVGMLVALLLDRTVGRRVRETRAVHEVVDEV
ncbi:potassium transporter Trk [Microbacterium sp. Marseille-Q6965]|uniref:potassium transporter Trk n=1 Tax=Microbacterium sp. Marseille-Q6965 TaxID=2965072 RepID=UPI0021B7DC24|nr:potassium transporter Trk [Microbacterium sp. Marseille-Q6965]